MADKKPTKKKASSKKYKMYEVAGGALKRKSNFCPKCGTGVFLAQHKDRVTCGKCSYTEFKKKE
ncbi:30S ribosomal protein S27ae [Candidatus Woesearchaeota archaeon]|nr:30S ribosomal protein S27ae [Candidatus Woesearchaeota archaeon]